ncbi:MBL fold metallo-hydrolase [Streptomyces sp. JJ36]|uniref:MBL fold metallo-hydrolase n=1 Tax=Streptomyces sp. JJ36 TaxID=2736645 RepID=UPI001F344242|nr:MBL fold metallo-hydrolase [Streptomyces sp. JJ36]
MQMRRRTAVPGRDGTRPRPVSRRGVLGATLAGGLAATGGATGAGAAGGRREERPAEQRSGRPRPSAGGAVRLRWLGNNGWEIRIERDGHTRTVLIDPWLTRFRTGTYTPEGADPDTPVTVDKPLIDRHGLRADQILVTHGHYDHLPDVPHLAATTGATVLGTESHVNMMRAMGAPEEQLSVVSGGELLQCDGYTVQVLPSLHSMVGEHPRVPFPGTRPAEVPPRPRVISDLVEGGTLAYRVTVNGFSIVNFGGSNFSEAGLAGVRADLVLMQPGGSAIHALVPRMLRALDHPAYVVPTHWDDIDHPLDEPARDWGGLDSLRRAVREASPGSRFLVLDHLETLTL